ncbi:MAG: shikimate kinase, partial [Arenicellales bacterium]
IKARRAVISTGGSAVYSAVAMQHLSSLSKIIYLSAAFEIIEERIKNLDTRGLAKRAHQSLYDLYLERTELYEKYAEITVTADMTAELVAEKIIAVVNGP